MPSRRSWPETSRGRRPRSLRAAARRRPALRAVAPRRDAATARRRHRLRSPRALPAPRGQGSEGNRPQLRRHRGLPPPSRGCFCAIRAPFATRLAVAASTVLPNPAVGHASQDSCKPSWIVPPRAVLGRTVARPRPPIATGDARFATNLRRLLPLIALLAVSAKRRRRAEGRGRREAARTGTGRERRARAAGSAARGDLHRRRPHPHRVPHHVDHRMDHRDRRERDRCQPDRHHPDRQQGNPDAEDEVPLVEH
jgi:hypothetical protein